MPIIETVGLIKKFGRTKAVDDVTLDIDQGETICIIGPNSAGKTTLMLLMGGIHYPSKGHVTVMGKHRWRENLEIKKRSTFLMAEPFMGACPTPYEYLRFYAQIYRIPKKDFLDKMKPMCDAMHLTEHLDKPLAELSLGMLKKVGLVSVFLPEVELRFLDEPFAGGIDPVGMEVLYRWMIESKARGETVVFSTQVLEQAETIADKLLLLEQGRVTAFDTPENLIAQAGFSSDEPRALHKTFLALTKG